MELALKVKPSRAERSRMERAARKALAADEAFFRENPSRLTRMRIAFPDDLPRFSSGATAVSLFEIFSELAHASVDFDAMKQRVEAATLAAMPIACEA